ncbi:MAG TPA: hypothetical protein VM221_03015 [Armatimonadota bacterium]|nr:hypothetical protein [Armatimonadota bacterium]
MHLVVTPREADVPARATYNDLLSRSDARSVFYHAGARKNIGFNHYRQGRYAEARPELEAAIFAQYCTREGAGTATSSIS